MKKRKTPIKICLLSNSKSAILSAIEIHNKPLFAYRYQVCVLLVINAWELLLKAYIYKNMKQVRLFNKDGTTKPFNECLDCVSSKLGNGFSATYQSVSLLYKYRNHIAHFYLEEMDIIVFSLLKPNILFYSKFIKQHFNIDLAKETGLVLLPIGFSKPYSPIDFISNSSSIQNSPQVIKDFVSDILISTNKLNDMGIEEPIVVDFKISLINEKRIKNADIIAGVNNQINNSAIFTVESKPKSIKLSNDPNAQPVRLTHEKDGTQGTLIHEELSEGLFKSINNVVDANMLLANNKNMFVFGEKVYYRIYAERQHVVKDPEKQYLLAKAGLNDFNSPFFYWICNLTPNNIAQLIFDFLGNIKAPNIRSLMRLTTLLGCSINDWLYSCFDNKWKRVTQPPNYYFAFGDIIKSKGQYKDLRLAALQISLGSKIPVPDNEKGVTVQDLMSDDQAAHNYLSRSCLLRFDDNKEFRRTTRILDVIIYGKQLESIGSNVEKEMMRSINWHRLIENISVCGEQSSEELE